MNNSFMRWVKVAVFLAGLGGALVAGGFLYFLWLGPHMKTQVNLRPFEAIMPLPPEGSVPMEPGPEDLPPLPTPPATPENVSRGEVYYHYYCLFCHGADGRGHGPVGDSYMPIPADLTSSRIQSYDDARLLRAMLLGTGHEPVLPRVVPPEHRPFLLLFMRRIPELPPLPPAGTAGRGTSGAPKPEMNPPKGGPGVP